MTSDPEYQPIGGHLYHYTSIEAFLSIAQQKKLRATALDYMNDASEGTTGFSRIKAVAEEELRTATGLDRALLEKLIWWLDNRYITVAGSVYLLCFSQAWDQLSQWRGYTPHGKGMCIGFPATYLWNRMQQVGPGWTFQNCRYTQASQMGFARAVVGRIRGRAAAQGLSSTSHADLVTVINEEAHAIFQTAALMKNAAFAEEQEVRFISPVIADSDPRVCFRAGRNSIVPYIEFRLVENERDLMPCSIELGIGPGPMQALTHRAAAHAVARYAFAQGTHYRPSIIPYREL